MFYNSFFIFFYFDIMTQLLTVDKRFFSEEKPFLKFFGVLREGETIFDIAFFAKFLNPGNDQWI